MKNIMQSSHLSKLLYRTMCGRWLYMCKKSIKQTNKKQKHKQTNTPPPKKKTNIQTYKTQQTTTKQTNQTTTQRNKTKQHQTNHNKTNKPTHNTTQQNKTTSNKQNKAKPNEEANKTANNTKRNISHHTTWFHDLDSMRFTMFLVWCPRFWTSQLVSLQSAQKPTAKRPGSKLRRLCRTAWAMRWCATSRC